MTESYDNGIRHRRQEVQQAVKNACDQLNADGVAPRDYVEQLFWLFFLKAFDEAEAQREEEAEFGDEVYRRRLNGEYRWTSWASRTDDVGHFLEVEHPPRIPGEIAHDLGDGEPAALDAPRGAAPARSR